MVLGGHNSKREQEFYQRKLFKNRQSIQHDNI